VNDKQLARDLLKQDYQHLADSFWKNEQSGETRVNWFIGIVAGTCGGLVTLRTAERRPCGEMMHLIVIAALLALLALGIVTLARISMRNGVTNEYKDGLRRIRDMLKALSGEKLLVGYSPFTRTDSGRRFGGLAHVVAVINSIIIAMTIGALFCPANILDGSADLQSSKPRFYLIIVLAIIIFGVSLGAQIFCLRYMKRQRGHLKPNRCGGIVYRTTDDTVEYLLVRPKHPDSTAEWVFPKGHIDESETHAEAAAREVREETGVMARPIRSVGRLAFKKNNERVVTEFYLMKATDTCEPMEQREIGWFQFDQALQELTHPESKRLLQLAEQRRITAAAESRAQSRA
jgi:ADP-ribose pyrophosphatase YjhB (NUDIX family)